MRKYWIIGIALAATLFIQCQKDGVADLDALKGHWVHAYEEEGPDGYQVYRPREFQDFPASRFRQAFHFKDNHACSFLVLAPNDAHYYQDGHWQYDAAAGIIRVSDEAFVIHEFRIVELTDELLKIEML